MHKCVVCSNTSSKTRFTRPEVMYHSFPHNAYRRKKWLKVFGIEQCFAWHRVCSDHFVKKHYRPGKKRFLRKDTVPLPPPDYTTQSTDVETENDNLLATDVNLISTDVETGNDNLSARDENLLSCTTETTDVETGNDNLLARDENLICYTIQSTDAETGNDNLLASDENLISYTIQSTDVETGNDNLSARDENCISYTIQSTDVENGNNIILARNQNRIREGQSAVVNNFESPRRSCRKIKLTTTNEDMSYENMPRLQTERFERPCPTLVANDNVQPVTENVEVPTLTTTKDYTLGHGALCSVKYCYNRYSKDLSFFGYPSDDSQRKVWIEKCRLEVDPTQKIKPGVRVCRAHFEDHCFMNPERKNRLRPNAVPTLFLDGENIEAKNRPKRGQRLKKQSPVQNKYVRTNANRPSCSASNYVAKIGSTETPLLVYIDSTIRRTEDFEACCCVTGCITNSIDEVEDISLFAPPKELVNAWSSALGLPLTENNILCERHFRPEDILRPTLLVDGFDRQLRSLIPSALPIPLNAVQLASAGMPLDAMQSASYAMQSASYATPLDAMQSTSNATPLDAMQSTSNATPLETNDVPVLRTYPGRFKRPKADEQSSAKKHKIDLPDKSKAATDKMYFSKNEIKPYTTVTNDTPRDNSTCDLDEKSESNSVIPVDLSIVKVEPYDDDTDIQTNLETETNQILPTIKPEPEAVENNDLLPLSSIDDSLSISLKKLKKISSNSSLSITLEPIDNTKITEPSVNLVSKMSAKSSMSITLQPKLLNNLSSTTHNSSPSVSLINILPSASNSSVYNKSQQSPLQYKPEAMSTSKMPHKLSSNTVLHPEIIDESVLFLKPTPNTNISNLSEMPKIQTPIISKCISLAGKSHAHSNSDSSKNNSEVIVIDDDDHEAFIQEDNGFIYEISKIVSFPTSFWKTEHNKSRNSTHFCQLDNFYKIIKKIDFNNSLLPTIHIFGKKYEYNKPIKTRNELHNLIEKINGIVKCDGFVKFANDDCIGFYEGNLKDVPLCSSCQKKYEELTKAQGSQTKTIRSRVRKVSEKSADLLRLKVYDEKNRSPCPKEDFTSLINFMVPRH
ncbi:uncharacterized protein LOC111027039 isoform X2 [Myzus persicae]|uniref:uncharacterized protein LOC111027039 isoform X2 n=1 Tax=Myzus persicae TaxID=13164 RepID=UPI000B9331BD|nr:uncharacterized protein LOC111027039 isoform X2 [Myzus persicae]